MNEGVNGRPLSVTISTLWVPKGLGIHPLSFLILLFLYLSVLSSIRPLKYTQLLSITHLSYSRLSQEKKKAIKTSEKGKKKQS